jgi:MFS family permease
VKIEGWLFAAGFLFYTLVGAVYGYLSRDIVGLVLLLFTGLLALIAGFYILYTSKRVYPRPEDRRDANIDEADPEYGFFSPHSWWPLAVGFAAFIVALGFVFAAWMFAFGVIVLLIAVSGWLFEYYYGDHAH